MAYGRIAGIGKITLNNNATADNETVLQTIDNVICFCNRIRNVTVTSGNPIGKLPAEIDYPSANIFFVAGYIESNVRKIGQFAITTIGNIISYQAITNGQVYLDGVCVHLNSTFYNDAIGNNIESNMSYPIGRK